MWLLRASGFVATKLFHTLFITIGLPKVFNVTNINFSSSPLCQEMFLYVHNLQLFLGISATCFGSAIFTATIVPETLKKKKNNNLTNWVGNDKNVIITEFVLAQWKCLRFVIQYIHTLRARLNKTFSLLQLWGHFCLSLQHTFCVVYRFALSWNTQATRLLQARALIKGKTPTSS